MPSASGHRTTGPVRPGSYETVEVEGFSIRVRPAYRHNGRSHAARWLVSSCPLHGGVCSKGRSVLMDAPLFGERGTLLYMGAWLRAGLDQDAHTHNSHEPTIEDMEEYGRSHGLLE